MKVDLSNRINVPGQYILTVTPEHAQEVEIREATMWYNGNQSLQEFVVVKGNKIHLNQTAQITDSSDLYVMLKIHMKNKVGGKIIFVPELIH